MRRMVTLLIIGTSACLQPVISLAAYDNAPIDIPSNLTERDKQILFRICDRTDERSRMRCFVRQLEKMGYDGNRTLPTGAFDVYTELDQTRIRSMLNAKQAIQDRVAERLKRRRNYSELAPTSDINTDRLDYVNTIRLEQLRCMRDVPPGRPRSLCLDQLKSDAKQYYRDYAQQKVEELERQRKAQERSRN